MAGADLGGLWGPHWAAPTDTFGLFLLSHSLSIQSLVLITGCALECLDCNVMHTIVEGLTAGKSDELVILINILKTNEQSKRM